MRGLTFDFSLDEVGVVGVACNAGDCTGIGVTVGGVACNAGADGATGGIAAGGAAGIGIETAGAVTGGVG